jgi:carboxylesterase
MRELSDYLANQGCTVATVRLPGHATSLRDLNRSRWIDWMAAVEDGFSLLCGVCTGVVSIGLSLGGVLSLLFASRYPVYGAVAMSTPYSIPPHPSLNPIQHFLPSMRYLSYLIPAFPKPPPLDYRDKAAAKKHVAYPAYSMRAVSESVELVEKMRESLPSVKAPVLVLHAKDDLGVPPINAKRIYADLGSSDKKLEWIERSGHVMTLEPAKHEVFQRVHHFATRVFRGGE